MEKFSFTSCSNSELDFDLRASDNIPTSELAGYLVLGFFESTASNTVFATTSGELPPL